MTTQTRMTLQEFLALPDEKPYREFINGEVVEKPLPNLQHGLLTTRLIIDVGNYLDGSDEGYLATEVRHLHDSQADQRVFLPDVHVNLYSSHRGHEGENPVRVQPDFAIEVLSPEDRPGRVAERVQFYLQSGTRLLWLVDPQARSVTVYRPGEVARVYRAGDILDGQPVLRDLKVDLTRLFAVLDRTQAR